MSGAEPSALRTWAVVLGFLAGLMLVLGGVAYLSGMMAGAHRAPSHGQTGARH